MVLGTPKYSEMETNIPESDCQILWFRNVGVLKNKSVTMPKSRNVGIWKRQKEFRNLGNSKSRNSGISEYRNSGIQEFLYLRISEIPQFKEFQSPKLTLNLRTSLSHYMPTSYNDVDLCVKSQLVHIGQRRWCATMAIKDNTAFWLPDLKKTR